MDADFATIAERFHGPPDSGNGGYTCGILGALIGDCATVELKAPPPLETPLAISESDGQWTLTDGERLIARGHADTLEIEPPAPPSLAEATAAEDAYEAMHDHFFPGCFTCGPDREIGDGLRIFAGKVGEREIVASHWFPRHDVAGEFGAVSTRVVWAALDCPTYFGGRLAGADRVAVLGRLTAKIVAPVEVDHEHVVIAWPVDAAERKFVGGSAIYTADGELRAYAHGTWINIDPDHAAFKVAG